MGRQFIVLMGVGMNVDAGCVDDGPIVEHKTNNLERHMCVNPIAISSQLIFFGLLVGASDPLRKLSSTLESLSC
jgi:ATP-binding cassette, subfamily B, bacterial MsbA